MSLAWPVWEQRFAAFLEQQSAHTDAAHDQAHVRRVVVTARKLAVAEGARLEIVLPAAWLHDCVAVPKDSPQRSQASRMAAETAVAMLRDAGYPEQHLPQIQHAIESHSFSARITPRTVEARVVQDADRLDALGAIGIARCFMLGGSLGRPLYDARQPFPEGRPADDSLYTVDHFYVKLLKLAQSMTTTAGRAEAQRRSAFMREYLDQLRQEIDGANHASA